LARPADLSAVRGSAGAFGKGALFLAGLIAAGLALRLLGSGFLAARPTPLGALMFFAAGAALTAFGVPRQAVAFAAGYAFGAWRGGVLAMAAQMLGCCVDFWWARAVARDWAVRRLRGRLARLDRTLAERPFTATLTLRLLPVGNNLLLNLLAGISGLRGAPFLAATLIGYLPQTAVFALAGSGVHVNRLVQLGTALGLFAISACLGAVLLMRTGSRTAGRAPDAEP
jgi:uncharacterized membrane protein YdjX (TVP38/TMEM64 family)